MKLENLTRARRLLGETDSPCSIEAALLAIDNNDMHAATRYIDAAEIQGSGEAIAYVRGNIAAKSGDYARAVAMYTDTLKQNPKHIRARLNRVSCYLGLNQALEAKEDADVLLSLAPQLKVAIFARGDAKLDCEWEGQRKIWWSWKMLHTITKHSRTRRMLSCTRPSRTCRRPINEALRLAPDLLKHGINEGCFTLWEKKETALSDFEAAIRADGNHLWRGNGRRLHHKLDNLEQAMAGWRGVLALINHALARKRLQQCEQLLSTT